MKERKIKGKVSLYKKEGNKYVKLREAPNLLVDDGIELILDFIGGLKSWWNPKDQSEYSGGDSGWVTEMYLGAGECMFNNASEERRDGTYGIPAGSEHDYQVGDTWLVSPEDSFLSAEFTSSGNTRIVPTITRRDQTLELTARFDVPGDLVNGNEIREFGFFLSSSGPTDDPSLVESQKPNAMLCRSALFDSGYYNSLGACNSDDSGAELCYIDDPWIADSDIRFVWEIGEL